MDCPNEANLESNHLKRSKKWLGWAALVCGVIVVIPPLIGLIGVVAGMVSAFLTLEKTGGADPEALAGDISVTLLSTFWGLVASALALIPFVVFLTLFLKQRGKLRRLTHQK